jgi:hypothetical protein
MAYRDEIEKAVRTSRKLKRLHGRFHQAAPIRDNIAVAHRRRNYEGSGSVNDDAGTLHHVMIGGSSAVKIQPESRDYVANPPILLVALTNRLFDDTTPLRKKGVYISIHN